jgi:imidazolonepropionase-like amidohydrolase
MRPRYTCLQNGTLIDESSEEPLEHASILIENDHIAAVGSVDDVRGPADEAVALVDVTGKVLLPGMIDCHFHGAYQDVTCWEDYDLRRPIEHTTLLAARNAQTLLEVGFTSARDTGTRALVAVAVRWW